MTGLALGSAFLAGIGLGLAGALLAIAVALFLWVSGLCRVSVALLAVTLGLLGAFRGDQLTDVQGKSIQAGAVRLAGTVDSFPTKISGTQRFEIETDHNSEIGPVRLCVLSESEPPVSRGSRIEIEGMVARPDDLSNNVLAALQSRQCAGSLQASNLVVLGQPSRVQAFFNSIRSRIASVFQRGSPGDAGALMTGLVTGDDSALSYSAKTAFLTTGTTHITAVSGSNFALIVVIATVASAGPGTRRRLPWLFAVTGAVWFYAVLVGLPPSALRAAIMATLAVIAVRYGRRPDFLSLLVICAALQLAIRPSDLHTLSFQLSVVATLALVLVFSARNTETPRQIAAGVAVTAVAACLATTPILALRLGEVTPATIPTNLLISPLAMIGFTLAAIAAGIGVLSPTLGIAAAVPASLVAEAILAIVERASYVFPMRHSTGAAPAGSLMVLTVVCWGIILAMSGDVKVVIARIWRWSGDAAEPVRAAVLAVPLVALIILGLGTLMR